MSIPQLSLVSGCDGFHKFLLGGYQGFEDRFTRNGNAGQFLNPVFFEQSDGIGRAHIPFPDLDDRLYLLRQVPHRLHHVDAGRSLTEVGYEYVDNYFLRCHFSQTSAGRHKACPYMFSALRGSVLWLCGPGVLEFWRLSSVLWGSGPSLSAIAASSSSRGGMTSNTSSPSMNKAGMGASRWCS